MLRASRLLLVCLACSLGLSVAGAPAAAHHKDSHGHGGGNEPSQSQASPTPTASPTAAPTPSPQPSASPTPGPGGQGPGGGAGDADLALATSSSPMLAQVGDRTRHSATVTNTGDRALEDVAVVAALAEEITLVSVDSVQGATSSVDGKRITWRIATLGPGASLELGWTGRVGTAGDLQAVTETSASAAGTGAQDSAITFLARPEGIAVDNPPADTVRKRVVTFVPAPVQPATVGTAPAGAPLPATGAEIALFSAWGAVLVWIGILLLVAGGQRSRRRSFALLASMLLVLSACTSQDAPDQAAPLPTSAPTTEEAEDDKPKDRVKGTRIERPGEGAEDVETDATTEPQAPSASLEPVGPPEMVRTVEVVQVPVGELPVERLTARDGDNSMAFAWDLDSRSITTATSSRRFIADAPVELLADLGTTQEALTSAVTLTNLSDDRRLAVQGRLLLDIFDAGGAIVATLESPPIDVVLEPGGTTSTQFDYLLATGDYSARARFQD